MSNANHVVFDIEGTIVSHDRVAQAVNTRFGPALEPYGVKPSFFTYTWFEVAEREYTYSSMSANYVPFIKVFRAVFYRILHMAGIPEPRAFASEDDLDHIMDQYALLDLRSGAQECIEILRQGGFTVWAFTAGDRSQVKGYFDKAEIHMPLENVLACDTSGVAKPDLRAYDEVLKSTFADSTNVWFAAAHMWDVTAARRAGYVYSSSVSEYLLAADSKARIAQSSKGGHCTRYLAIWMFQRKPCLS